MAKTLEQVLQEQLGGMAFLLCAKDVEISTLRDKIVELQCQLAAKGEADEKA